MEKFNEIILKIINNVTKVIFIAILIVLTIASIFSTCTLVKGEKTEYHIDNWFLNIICIIISIAVIVFVKRKNIKINKKTKKILLIVGIAIWTLLAFFWIFSTQLRPRADQKYIYRAAIGMVEHDFSEFKQGGYINSNPQQEGMLLLEYFIALISKKYMGIIIQFLNIFALLAAFYAIYKITQEIFQKGNNSIATLVCLLLFIPIFLYITFMYGNIFGLATSMLALLFEFKYLKKEKWYYIVLSGVLIALSIKLKSNYLITLIAMIIIYIIDMFENKKAKNIIAIISILLIYIIINAGAKLCVEKITGEKIDKGIPMTAYVAMGMQEGKFAPGWYNGYNRKVYKKNKYNSEEASKQSIEDIKERVNVFFKDPGYMIEFYAKKTLSQWNNPTFQGFWVNKSRSSKIKKPGYVKSIVNKGKGHPILEEYTDLMQALILFGATVYVILDYKNIKGIKLSLMIIFIGGFLFHTIWEAKCQYTITYFLLLIPYCVKGYDILTEKIKEKMELNILHK